MSAAAVNRNVWTGGLDSVDELRAAGYEGFVSVADLDDTACTGVPVARGAFVVLRLTDEPPVFLPKSGAGRYRGADPSVPIAELERRWVPGAIVLDVAAAAGTGVRGQLQQRIKRRIRFSKGANIGAPDGRLLWQLRDHRALQFAWKVCDDPEEEADRLRAAFKGRYGSAPFATLETEPDEA